MLYNLVNYFEQLLTRYGLFGYVRVLTYPEFRAVVAIVFSFCFVMVMGRPTIHWLVKKKIGDNPEFYNKDLNQITQSKANTPTMGGILISGSILLVTVLLADLYSFYVQMAILCIIWLTVLGGVDDYLKLTSAQRGPGRREGLYTWEKLVFQVGLALLLGLFIHSHGTETHQQLAEMISRQHPGAPPDTPNMTHILNLPFLRTWLPARMGEPTLIDPNVIELSPWLFGLLTVLVITGSSNAVNLTDGMDGLASGVTIPVAFAFFILTLIAGRLDWARFLLVPYIPLSDELSIVAGAMVGSCLGFLWFNCHPAQVFMGDTGSLTLGGLLGYIAVVIRQEFLLLIIGGIFVVEALSVILQVGYFKLTKGRPGGGRRLFRMAPIHHHFHLAGWTEQQVVVRFWVLTAVLAALALATVKLR